MISFSDIEPFLNYLNNEYVNTGLNMKVHNLNLNSNDFWNVTESTQTLSFANMDRLRSAYQLFYESNKDVEYIQYKSFQNSIKIYVKVHKVVISVYNNQILDVQKIRELCQSMNIENILVSIR